MPQVEIVKGVKLDQELALSIVKLKTKVWPKPDSHEVLVAKVLDYSKRDDSQYGDMSHFIVWDEDDPQTIIAHSQTFLREVRSGDQKFNVLALAAVCTDPEKRGLGLGKLVVEKSFAQIDEGLVPVCLFQTGVQEFYEKLNCRRIENRFVNSFDQQEPHKRPFWDKCEMIYPANADWPEGDIDLLGPGY